MRSMFTEVQTVVVRKDAASPLVRRMPYRLVIASRSRACSCTERVIGCWWENLVWVVGKKMISR